MAYTLEEFFLPKRKICFVQEKNYMPGKWLTKNRQANPLSEHINILPVYCWINFPVKKNYLHSKLYRLALIHNQCVFLLLLSAVGARVSGAGARPSPNQTKPKQAKVFRNRNKQATKLKINSFFLLQVKIWFQNHRYKHKRQAKEKAMTETPGGSGSSPRRSDPS